MQITNTLLFIIFSATLINNPSFIIERSKDANQIFYVVNPQMLDTNEPIQFYY